MEHGRRANFIALLGFMIVVKACILPEVVPRLAVDHLLAVNWYPAVVLVPDGGLN